MDSELELPAAGGSERALAGMLRAVVDRILDDLPPEGLRLIRTRCAEHASAIPAEAELLREIDRRLAGGGPSVTRR